MIWCFVHAPTADGWAGELVLALRKKTGKFKLSKVHTIIAEMYADDDPFEFDYALDVPRDQVESYLERKARGVMQRISIAGTKEDIHFDEWEKNMRKKYPDIFFLQAPRVKSDE